MLKLNLDEITAAHGAWSSNPNECWIERGEREDQLLAWLPALVEELREARAEIERLSQYVPMKHLEETALTPEAASRIWDRVQQLKAEATDDDQSR